MQNVEVAPGVRLSVPKAEWLVDVLIDALNRYYGDPDLENGEHDGREPDGDLEWDARDGEMPPVDALTGFDVIQDEDGRSY